MVSGGRCKANKIWVAQLRDKSNVYVPIVWADTTGEQLLTKFKIIMETELKNMTDKKPEERLPYILDHLARTGEKTRPLYMEHHPVKDHARQVIDQKNSTGTEARFDYDRVQEKGLRQVC